VESAGFGTCFHDVEAVNTWDYPAICDLVLVPLGPGGDRPSTSTQSCVKG
jgi:hypothetical protein